ncbi:MAG: glycogen/starch synthase [Bacteroidales bacterium]|nr:glycogen/starch synthase [Bacteroidales bacterium]
MYKELITPDYIFEASWEVCNKVGGIYTVLSTRAAVLQERHRDHLIFIGPDFWIGKENPLFEESDTLCMAWKKHAIQQEGLQVRVGRWNIPGHPIVFLVDFTPLYKYKNEIYTEMWNRYQVDSLHAYGDYDEASMFAIAAGKVVESFYRYNLTPQDKVIFQAHEWMTGMAALYLQITVPEIATIFTTHATSIGRSIAGNNKPLYDYLFAYNGDQMAEELNMQSKHSIEKQTAHHVDCFTTVSNLTDNECKELLDKPADVVLMNGFEDDFVPKGSTFTGKRKRARSSLLNVARCLFGEEYADEDTLLIGIGGRYEFKNKGIDVFLDAMGRLKRVGDLQKKAVAFVTVPAWVGDAREDLKARLEDKQHKYTDPLPMPFLTHWLKDMQHDCLLNMLQHVGIQNAPGDQVKVIFVPCYLDGKDGIVNKSYYDTVIGLDISVYPSYYEPWGYTPLESAAFHVPTITTDLTGFGLWVKSLKGSGSLLDGVKVIHRSDYNYHEVADAIEDTIAAFSTFSKKQVADIRRGAAKIAEQALWKHFIEYYYEAYDIAFRNAQQRLLGNINY